MLVYKRLLLLLVFVGVFATSVFAQDRAAEIRTMLEQRDDQIKTLLGDQTTFSDEQRASLKTLINGVIDFRAMGATALGRHWEGLEISQKDEFVEVFSDIVRAQSLSDLDVYRASVTYEEITTTGDSAYVKTTTVYKDKPAKVEYIMGWTGAEWRVHDIVLDDVSTASGYARSFQTAIRKRGFEGLMTSLNKRRDKMNEAG